MLFKKQVSIRRTLSIYFALFALIPLAIVVLVALNAVNQSAYRQAAEQRNLAVEVRLADIERFLLNAESGLELLLLEPAQRQRVVSLVSNRGLPSSSRPVTIRNIERAFRQQLDSQNSFSRFFVYNLAGEVVVSSTSDDTETSIITEEYFNIFPIQATNIHPAYYNPQKLRPELYITTPLRDEGEQVLGYLVGEINFAAIDALLAAPIGSSQSSEIYLVDRSGILLAPSSPNLQVGTVLESAGIQAARTSSRGTNSYQNYRGRQVIGAFRYLPDLELALIAEIEAGEALQVSSQIQALSLAVSLLALIGVLFIGSLAARQFTRPIAVLTDTAEKVIAGDLSQRAHINSHNEIGRLADAFNQMTERLNNLINTLEQRIAARTKELEIARQEAEAASQAKSVFLSNMSHELRTPLNMVIGYTSSMLNMPQMYAGQDLPPIFRDDVRLIQQNGQHLLGLINDILDLSKIEAGKFAIHMGETDINEIFKGVMATSIGLVNNKPIQLRNDFPHDLPKVWGDATRIRQILLNLLSNAIKYTQAGVVSLHAHVNGKTIFIAVKDTGVGIPQEALATIFDRFEQGQNDPSIQGTGLGLDISQRLAQMHGSRIRAESEVGKGSTFYFDLPIVQPEYLAQAPSIPTAIPMPEPEIELGEDRVILLAETNASTRQAIHFALETQSFVIVDVQEGDDVAEYAATLAPDVIVLSGNFASEKAFDLMQQLKLQEDSKNIPIIILAEQNLDYPIDVERCIPSADALPDELEQLFKSV